MDETLCVATLTGTDSALLVLQVIEVTMHEDGAFDIQSYWDEGENFFEALRRQYDCLSLAWYDATNPSAGAKQEITYTSYGGFGVTGELTTKDHLSLSLANIHLQARQSVHA
jgi:hypothetical protein